MSVTLHTSEGDVKIELHCEQVPRSAANFLALCAGGQYDGTLFHRVVPSFIVQGGDPTGKGTVSRAAFGRRLPDEPHASLTFAHAGVVAFANAGRPSSKGVGSQFFVTLAPAPHLDGSCTVVGRVIHGLDAVARVAERPLDDAGRPQQPATLDAVTVHANPFASGHLEFTLP